MFTMSLAGDNRPPVMFKRASLAAADVALIFSVVVWCSRVVVWCSRVGCPGYL